MGFYGSKEVWHIRHSRQLRAQPPGTLFCKKYFVINLEEERGRNEKKIFYSNGGSIGGIRNASNAKETSTEERLVRQLKKQRTVLRRKV
jgi:hypothetical protein